jgi:hypothetical protein
MEEKEDAGAHPFWALCGVGDCRGDGNDRKMNLSGWPNPMKRNRRMAMMLNEREHARTRARESEGVRSRTQEQENLHLHAGLELWRAAQPHH